MGYVQNPRILVMEARKSHLLFLLPAVGGLQWWLELNFPTILEGYTALFTPEGCSSPQELEKSRPASF